MIFRVTRQRAAVLQMADIVVQIDGRAARLENQFLGQPA